MSKPICFVSIHDKDRYEAPVTDLDTLGEFRFAGTEGTSEWCRSLGVDCEPMSSLLDMSPALDGQVKTLHPDLYKGILAGPDEDLEDSVPRVGAVLVDLTPCRDEGGLDRKRIDIGGVSLIRAAAKNAGAVIPMAAPDSVARVVDHYPPSDHAREWLASRALRRTLRYDKEWLGEIDSAVGNAERSIRGSLPAHETLRYGENPSQEAHYRSDLFEEERDYQPLAGDDLSYTNLLDIDAARKLVEPDDSWEVSVIKHTNPTGWASGEDPESAVRRAWNGDPKSAFGGVVGVNQAVSKRFLDRLDDWFVEALVAPGFDDAAVAAVEGDARPRLVRYEGLVSPSDSVRSLSSGYLTQTSLDPLGDQSSWECVTDEAVSDPNRTALEQMWRITRWVTSNAAVIGTRDQALAVGAGQQSRVDAVKVAVEKLSEHHPNFDGPLVMASDGFFPFPDNIEIAGRAGVEAIISPGGSVKDDEVIGAANEHGIAMIFTNQRIFHH
jgi:phosphoribosylaminoimidazolecarboxamide formyltransferase/IMP cyclohydrolase